MDHIFHFTGRKMPLPVTHNDCDPPSGAQNRNIVQLIEQILLKRTEVLCKQDGLQTSRDFLNSSLNNVIEALDLSSTGNWTAENLAGGIAAAREGIDARGTAPSCSDSGIFLDQSCMVTNDRFCEIPSFPNLPLSMTPRFDPRSLFATYEIDMDHLKEQEIAFKSLTGELSNLEYRLHGALKALEKSLDPSEVCKPVEHGTIARGNASLHSSTMEKAARDTSPILDEYYSCKSDVGIYSERLQELDFCHEEGLVERQFLREHGHNLNVSDDDFHHNYERRRTAILTDLDATRACFDAVTERCRDAGIDIGEAADESDSFDCLSLVSVSELPAFDTPETTSRELAPRQSRAVQTIHWFQNVIYRKTAAS